jgi:hypothetical protein
MSARIAFLLLLLVFPARREVTEQAAGAAPFLVAALRRDDIVLPFAAFDGKNWSAPWPQSLLRSPGEGYKDPPKDLASVPRDWWGKSGPLTELTAWANGVSRGTIHLHPGKPALVHVMCDRRFGIASDYKASEELAPNTIQPHPKDGIAVSGGQPVEALQIVAPSAPEWAAAARQMTAEFDEAEERAAHTFTDWKHPFNKVERRRYVPRIEAMYGAPMDEPGWTAYYFEAVRQYPPGPDDRGCGLVTSASGWMAVAPNGKRSFNLRARITYCDRDGVRYMLPLGLIKARERNYWAYQMSGFGRETYLIVRPRPKEIISEVQYSAGTCPF